MGKQKLYAYVDESGQDTKGGIFVVSIVVLENERDAVRERLEEIEQRTGKGAVKWHKSKHEFRRAYIEARGRIGTPPPRLRRSLLRYKTENKNPRPRAGE